MNLLLEPPVFNDLPAPSKGRGFNLSVNDLNKGGVKQTKEKNEDVASLESKKLVSKALSAVNADKILPRGRYKFRSFAAELSKIVTNKVESDSINEENQTEDETQAATNKNPEAEVNSENSTNSANTGVKQNDEKINDSKVIFNTSNLDDLKPFIKDIDYFLN
jgi:hypothetical protein